MYCSLGLYAMLDIFPFFGPPSTKWDVTSIRDLVPARDLVAILSAVCLLTVPGSGALAASLEMNYHPLNGREPHYYYARQQQQQLELELGNHFSWDFVFWSFFCCFSTVMKRNKRWVLEKKRSNKARLVSI